MATKRTTSTAPGPGLETMPLFDASVLMKMQQASFDTIIEANRMFVETARAVAHCQSEMMRDCAEHMTRAMTEMAGAAAPEDKVKAQAECAKDLFERTAGHMHEIAGLIGKSNADAIKLMNGRIHAAMDQAPSMEERQHPKRAAAE